MKADPLFAPLNLADINRVQIRLLRQFFLAHANPSPAITDCFAKNLELLWTTRHSASQKQEQRNPNTPNMGVF